MRIPTFTNQLNGFWEVWLEQEVSSELKILSPHWRWTIQGLSIAGIRRNSSHALETQIRSSTKTGGFSVPTSSKPFRCSFSSSKILKVMPWWSWSSQDDLWQLCHMPMDDHRHPTGARQCRPPSWSAVYWRAVLVGGDTTSPMLWRGSLPCHRIFGSSFKRFFCCGRKLCGSSTPFFVGWPQASFNQLTQGRTAELPLVSFAPVPVVKCKDQRSIFIRLEAVFWCNGATEQ